MTLSYGWEESNNTWKYKQKDGTYVTDAWKQDNGNWYYFGENSIMVTNQETPDGYYVNAEGVGTVNTKQLKIKIQLEYKLNECKAKPFWGFAFFYEGIKNLCL